MKRRAVGNSKIQVDEIAERLRREPYLPLSNDCLIKSVRLVRKCRKSDIDAKVVLCLGLASAKMPLLARRVTIPVIHAWGEVEGERIEVSRPLGSQGMLGVVPVDIRPIVTIRL
ncbi:MAG: hypothetical protein KAX23_05185 [Dehalococcoidia bacterium]|nr:hypothetical protein [Dehalococcoidia bacterium]